MSRTLEAVEPLLSQPFGETKRVPQPKRNRQIRVDDDVADMVEELSSLRKKSAPTLLSEMLRPWLKRELQKEMERRMKELKEQPSKE
jgi:hypothetical protein